MQASSLPTLQPAPNAAPDPSTIDATLLAPSQQTLLQELLSTPTTVTSSSASQRLQSALSNLEPTLDTFATSVYALGAYNKVIDDWADGTLAECASLLEERDREGVRRATNTAEGEKSHGEGTREVLRGLSRILEER